MITSEYSTLISIHARPQCTGLLASHPFDPDVVFPDGSVLYINYVEPRLVVRHSVKLFNFRSFARYGIHRFTLAYPSRYAALLKPEGFRCGCGIGTPSTVTEAESDHVTLLVCFKEDAKVVLTQYIHFLDEWLRSVSQSGIQGEGPVKLADSRVWFDRHYVIVKVRNCESGQQTLNWLFLSHLNFGMRVSAVYGVFCVEAMAAVGQIFDFNEWSSQQIW